MSTKSWVELEAEHHRLELVAQQDAEVDDGLVVERKETLPSGSGREIACCRSAVAEVAEAYEVDHTHAEHPLNLRKLDPGTLDSRILVAV